MKLFGCFKIRAFGKKRGPCGKPEGKKNNFLKNISKGHIKMGSDHQRG